MLLCINWAIVWLLVRKIPKFGDGEGTVDEEIVPKVHQLKWFKLGFQPVMS